MIEKKKKGKMLMSAAVPRKIKDDVEADAENVSVYIRVRPLNKKEKIENVKNVIHLDSSENVLTLIKPNGCNEKTEKAKTFKFDHIFAETTTQIDIYRRAALPIVDKVLNGYNGTIFAYGQTGTGKTYTMSGYQKSDELKGIIPNTFSHIFSQIARSNEKTFVVTVTYVEIYNEEIRDLLSKNNKLEIREIPSLGVYIKDLVGCPVCSVESMVDLMNRGNTNRITRSTMMNDVSSRSHAIFSIRIEMKDKLTNKSTTGKLNLVDLAGSERLAKTQATGERLREASSINQSLSVLGNVISALVDGKGSHIPYRNSKLTRLLKDSLGGNSKTAMIAMLSPSELDYDESLCTLRYASRVKYIKNYTQVNTDKLCLIESFENEIKELQERIKEITLIEEKLKRPKTRKKKEGKKEKAITDEMMAEIQRQDEEIAKSEKEKEELIEKINRIQERILVGGENLYLKAQQQEFLLQSSEAEIKHLDETHRELEEKLSRTGAERIDVEEKYCSLQEEDAGITRKIKKVQSLLQDVKEEYADKEQEYQREIETLAQQNQSLSRELMLISKVIDHLVPKEYQEKIKDYCILNPETGEYQLRGVAYAGNNMREIKHYSNSNKRDANRKMKSPYGKYLKLGKYFRQNLCMVPRYGQKSSKTPAGTPPDVPCATPKGINIVNGRPYYTLPVDESALPSSGSGSGSGSASASTLHRLKAALDQVHDKIKH